MVLALVAALIGGYSLYRFGMHQGMKVAMPMADSPAAAADSGAMQQGAGADKKPLYWHDPMYPTQKFDKPGKSPFMDMQLVPVYGDGGGADEGKVSISSRVQQNLGIRTADVTKGSMNSAVLAVGSVAYNERDVELVQARSNGFVERLYVRAPLDPVKKGQPLAELYVPDWIAAQEEYLTARRMQGSGLDGLIDGARQRMRLAGMNDDQIHLVESSAKVHSRMTIVAPVSGVVADLAVREGMTVMAGAPLFRINGLNTVWVNAEIPENVAAQVRPGNAVEARTPALPGTLFKGKVGAILPGVNVATRTLIARIELANPGGELVPGMFATINLASMSRNDVLLVPSEAVIQTGTRSVVMLAQGEGKFIPVDVETGAESNGQTEIRKGLEAGQKVVVSGQFLIDSEASLKGTTTRMSDMSAPDGDKAMGSAHHGIGKVEHIGSQEITISHGPIPTLQWGTMTMNFKLPSAGLPHNVAVGDMVTFDIRQLNDGTFQIAVISPTADVSESAMKDMAPGNAMKGGAKDDMKADMKMPAKPAGVMK
jgi:Cu(I)/Ag(I) efflux system membrane fusion protein